MLNSLRIPALQERTGDIPLLAEYFLKAEAVALGKKITGFSPEFLGLLEQYDFPDNVRELKNIVERAASEEPGDVLTADSLPPHMREMLTRSLDEKAEGFRPRKLVEIECEHVAKMLAYFDGDRARAAEALGMSEEEMETVLNGAK
jgi:DNA-binding NtrC family response regulator